MVERRFNLRNRFLREKLCDFKKKSMSIRTSVQKLLNLQVFLKTLHEKDLPFNFVSAHAQCHNQFQREKLIYLEGLMKSIGSQEDEL